MYDSAQHQISFQGVAMSGQVASVVCQKFLNMT